MSQGGELAGDEFQQLVGDGRASVTVSCGMNFPFGDAKATVSVRLTCNQDSATIHRAGEVAMTRALEICKDGIEYAIMERNKIVAGATG